MKAIIFDFEALFPNEINYQKSWDLMFRTFGTQQVGPKSRDFLNKLATFKAHHSEDKDAGQFFEDIAELLDEIELSQIDQFSLYPAVKNGLASLKTMKLLTGATTSMGAKAAEKLLDKQEIRVLVGELVARDNIEGGTDLGLRLKLLMERLKLERPEEIIYFCTTIPNLRVAKTMKLMTMVLPSKKEKMDLLLLEKPDGLLITLDELPVMLSLDTFKGPPALSTSSLADGNQKMPEENKDSRGAEGRTES